MARQDDAPSIREIAALTARLQHLRSPQATEAERAAFLADKDALIERIQTTNHDADTPAAEQAEPDRDSAPPSSPPRRVLVTGSRTWTDTATIREALAAHWGDGTAVLVTGACPRGADQLAEACWRAWGGTVERHPADWDRDGRAAGFRRNADMVAAGADVCLAFVHGESRGTQHTADLAARADIPTHRYPHPERTAEKDRMATEGTRTADPTSTDPTLTDPDQTDGAHGDERADEAAVMERAAAGGYAMVGPSAQNWSVDPVAGIPTGLVPEAEHRLVRDLIARERLDGADPAWLRCADGGQEIVAAVVPARPAVDDPVNVSVADRDAVAQPAASERSGEDDGWFSDSWDAAHTAYLDALGRTDARTGWPPDVLDGRVVPPLPAPDAAGDGIEQDRTGPTGSGDPAELDARLAVLRDRLATSGGEPAGGWHTVSAEAAARELAGRGTDLDTARAAVADYLRETSERIGAPADEWGLDQGDIDAIATTHQLPTPAEPAAAPEAGEPEYAVTPAAASAVARAHEALAVLAEPAARPQHSGDDVRAAELAGWAQQDDHAARAAEDESGWGR